MLKTQTLKINMNECRCEEASILSRETFIPCGRPANWLVWSDRDRKAYCMCDSCYEHNVQNRGMVLVAEARFHG